MSLTIQIVPSSSNTPSSNEIQPNAEGWYRGWVLPDWMSPIAEPPYQNREVTPDPAVWRIGVKDDWKSHNKVKLNAPWQFFWAELLALHKYGKRYALLDRDERDYINGKFHAIIGPSVFLTNRPPDQEVADYVNETGLEFEPPKVAALVCSGCTLWVRPAGRNRDGIEMIEVFSLKENQTVPEIPANDPASILLEPYVMWATAIYGKPFAKVGEIAPFSTLGQGVGVPYPLITKETYYFPRKGVKFYSHRSPFLSQYVPARETYP